MAFVHIVSLAKIAIRMTDIALEYTHTNTQASSRTLIRQIVKRTFLYTSFWVRYGAVDAAIERPLKMEQLIFPKQTMTKEQKKQKNGEKFHIFIAVLCAIQSFLFGRTTRTCYFHIHIHIDT